MVAGVSRKCVVRAHHGTHRLDRRGARTVQPVDVGLDGVGQRREQQGVGVRVAMGEPAHLGSVAIHVPAVDTVFVGDALTTGHVLTGAHGPQPAPFTLDPDGAAASLTAIEHLDARWVLPGHGPPWDGGVAAAVERIRGRTA